MIIKVERAGGLTGIISSNQIESDQLPGPIETTVDRIMKTSDMPTLKSLPKGSADQFTYKITIEDKKDKRVIECNQFELQPDLKSLVKYVEANSKKSNLTT